MPTKVTKTNTNLNVLIRKNALIITKSSGGIVKHDRSDHLQIFLWTSEQMFGSRKKRNK